MPRPDQFKDDPNWPFGRLRKPVKQRKKKPEPVGDPAPFMEST